MKITTRYIEDELFVAENSHGNSVNIDMRNDSDKQSLGPVEMIVAAVAGCAAVDIIEILKKKRKEVIDLIIESTADRKENHPRGITKIYSKYTLISPNTSLDTFEKVAIMATNKYCSAADSVKAEIEITCEVQASK